MYVTGHVNRKLLLQNEDLVAENRILRAHFPSRLRLTDPQRSTFAEIDKRLGRKALAEVALVASRNDNRLVSTAYRSEVRRLKASLLPGPSIGDDVMQLIVRMARENSGWGHDRIAGALSNLGHKISNQTVGNILRRHGIASAPKRSQSTT